MVICLIRLPAAVSPPFLPHPHSSVCCDSFSPAATPTSFSASLPASPGRASCRSSATCCASRAPVWTLGVAEVLGRPLLPPHDRIDLAFVYGSVAAGRELAGSDIDVLIVSEYDPRELATVLAEAGEQLGREVNVATYSPHELRSRWAAGTPFLSGVLDGPKIWLLGDDVALRTLLRGPGPAGA